VGGVEPRATAGASSSGSSPGPDDALAEVERVRVSKGRHRGRLGKLPGLAAVERSFGGTSTRRGFSVGSVVGPDVRRRASASPRGNARQYVPARLALSQSQSTHHARQRPTYPEPRYHARRSHWFYISRVRLATGPRRCRRPHDLSAIRPQYRRPTPWLEVVGDFESIRPPRRRSARRSSRLVASGSKAIIVLTSPLEILDLARDPCFVVLVGGAEACSGVRRRLRFRSVTRKTAQIFRNHPSRPGSSRWHAPF